jgi:DNA (cytosine-5)-methyltransferase 1
MGIVGSDVDNPNQLPTVLSLCTGYGGIERGLSLAGFEHRTVAYVETEAFAIANLVAKMEAGQLVPAPVWSDLKTLPAQCFRERIDVLTGGYPCQPFSAAGLRKGTEDPRHLWPYIYDHIRTIRPIRCFFENVEGHISLGLREVIEDLESLGYTVAWGIFSAAEVGAPHQRKRVYILAHANSAGQQPSEGQSAASQARHNAGRGGEDVPNAIDERSQGRVLRRQGKERQSQQRHVGRSGAAHRQPRGFEEELISELGRGFDGPATWLDGSWEVGVERVTSSQNLSVERLRLRVDRLRLLGNGVVPDTAAKAWIVLNDQLASE